MNLQLPMVRQLLTLGFDASEGDAERNTPVMRACFGGSVAVLDALRDAGALPEGADVDGMTPVMCAAYGGHVAALTWLAEAGARFDEGRTTASWYTGAGKTAAALAAEQGHAQALEVLLSRGDAQPGALDDAGRSLLDIARAAGAGDAVLRLLGAAGDPLNASRV